MKLNMGQLDRVARIVLAIVMLYLAFGTGIAAAGALHWILIVVAVVFILTSLVGYCPLYGLVGIRTCRKG